MKVFRKLFNSIKFFFGDIFDFLRNNSHVAVKVTDILKTFVENPLLGIVTDLTPTDVDNKVLKKLRKIVPEVATKVAIVHGIISESDKDSDAIAGIIEYLKPMAPDARIGFWVEFSARLNVALSDGEISLHEAIILAQLAYGELKK